MLAAAMVLGALACALMLSEQALAATAPSVVAESVLEVTGSSATLEAEIDPGEAQTTYHFELGTSEGVYTTIAPVPDGELVGGVTPGEASAHVQGLAPATTYHYRIVAHNGEGTVDGPDQTFVTQGPGGELALPDGRQWEMVSSPNKQGALIQGNDKGATQAAAAGNAITYLANAPTEDAAQGSGRLEQVLSTRGPAGWESRDITVPNYKTTGAGGNEYDFFSEDLSSSLVEPPGQFAPPSSTAVLSDAASELTPYVRADFASGDVGELCTSGCYRPLVTGCPPVGTPCPQAVQEEADVPPGTVFSYNESSAFEKGENENEYQPQAVGATPDLSHVVLGSLVPLTSSAVRGELYEWSGGQLEPVSVLPGNEGPDGGVFGGKPLGQQSETRGAISNDGSRIIWTAGTEGLDGAPYRLLYMRDTVTQETVQLDAAEPQCLQEGQCKSGEGVFQFASADGSRVFFEDARRLTRDASPSSGPHLYECEMVVNAGELSCKLSDLTPGVEDVQGNVLGGSEDGSYVYYVSGENDNVYELHYDGSGWEAPRRIAALSGEDAADWGAEGGSLPSQSARVSPSGRWLAFMAHESLTGYDNRDAVNGVLDVEVYLFDSNTGRLVCASCEPTGARPVGFFQPGFEPTNLRKDFGWSGSWVAATVPGWTTPGSISPWLYQSRYLSNNGRLFFDGYDALVPLDVNGTWDVYQYEPEGVGTCTSAVSSGSSAFEPVRRYTVEGHEGESGAGCVSLISSGSAAVESAFLDASATGGRDAEGGEGGGDVFFLTTAKLSTLDVDDSYDVYDAHECTNSAPCFPPPAGSPPPCANAEACRAAPTPQPSVFGAPASATFSGAGNLAPPAPGVEKRTAKAPTRAQRLATALRACRRKPKRTRAACERRAKQTYGGRSGAKGSQRTRKGVR